MALQENYNCTFLSFTGAIWSMMWSYSVSSLSTLCRTRSQSLNDLSPSCGFECENCYHLFMECPLYDIGRNVCVILRIYDETDLNVILYGNTEISIDQDKICFFLKESNIFG